MLLPPKGENSLAEHASQALPATTAPAAQHCPVAAHPPELVNTQGPAEPVKESYPVSQAEHTNGVPYPTTPFDVVSAGQAVHEADAAFQYWPGMGQSQAQRRW